MVLFEIGLWFLQLCFLYKKKLILVFSQGPTEDDHNRFMLRYYCMKLNLILITISYRTMEYTVCDILLVVNQWPSTLKFIYKRVTESPCIRNILASNQFFFLSEVCIFSIIYRKIGTKFSKFLTYYSRQAGKSKSRYFPDFFITHVLQTNEPIHFGFGPVRSVHQGTGSSVKPPNKLVCDHASLLSEYIGELATKR